MAELIWRGKYDADGRRAQPVRTGPPLRTVETIGAGPWYNRLILGDKARVLPALLPEFEGQVDLIYLDPPFATGSAFRMGPQHGGMAAYCDAWPDVDTYLHWFYETVVLARDLLKDTGSIYVHLAHHVGHLARAVMDEVFGTECFQNEIIWYYRTGGASRRRFARKHDNIFFYSKSPTGWTFYPQKERSYMMHRYGFPKSSFQVDPETQQQYSLVYARDVWEIPAVGSATAERRGYPTQKPERLLERIIRASSRPDDLVLDCFAGSGTSAAVASRLGRRWVAVDSSPLAVQTIYVRLLQGKEDISFKLQETDDQLDER